MNCKPGQLAWIKVPPDSCKNGIETLNNRVVRTERLLSGQPELLWVVTPPLYVKFTGLVVDPRQTVMFPGDIGRTEEILDDWLRPFDPDSAPVDVPVTVEQGVPA